MAGHSQFSNIKHRKGTRDVRRSQKFTRLIREIMVIARQGLPNPELNPRLRSVVSTARRENLPKDKIKTAIRSATGSVTGENYEEVQYEGYGPSGTALIVHALTNNRNRTISKVRYIFSRKGGNLGETGDVSYLFNHVGLITYKAEGVNFEDLFSYGIELEVLDVEEDNRERLYVITCKVEDFGRVRDAFYAKFGEPELARLSWQPKDLVKVSDKKLINKLSMLIEELEDNSDVQYVEGNFTFSDSI
ncbi:YebC/PmpR family DNA-binding transcriptional regulator [Wolbachia endosymbiont of Dirofilaria (Dirofilaria) immitis]|uniref:YebC/PmpR family DNA-binding transcriptional regulator n=1 Tax=Wolbachia endosymbiont of Dirofilaria (Dirofilaria) immitis TaxID=1812115 RepID=UPI00158897F9|nr:YebC/PmpR family DNA-binding transcriptional regulator [Wolbachia endosymbiont of Dirofilaria (Dirofilaria) immitis]QKX02228.1 YebC/PmpR family DNA-binding transcriptional regulator [Wolbachia endosymbiont of Dirofilaria (Dirofilaria) immitis]